MIFSDKYVYLIALIPFCILWILFYIFKPRLRKEMITIPIEEFVFWFIAGMWVGPFYETIMGVRYKK